MINVLHTSELQGQLIRSGIGRSVEHQRRALSGRDDVSLRTDLSWVWQVPFRKRALQEADILHYNFPGLGALWASHIAPRYDTKVIAHAHITPQDIRGSFRGSGLLSAAARPYLRHTYNRADRLVTVSDHARSNLREFGVKPDIRIITNGVDLQAVRGADPAVYRNMFNVEPPVIFSIGQVFERKGVEAFCEVARKLPEYDFIWFGEHDQALKGLRTGVASTIKQAPSNVTFTGWVDDRAKAFAAGDIGFFPTHEENEGIAVLEAMGTGHPVVLRDIPVFERYDDGAVCRKASGVDDFVEAISDLLSNSQHRRAMGEAAREQAENYSLDAVGGELMDVYRDVTDC